MAFNLSLNSTDSDVFYVEQSSNDQSVPRPNTPIVLNSTEISGDGTREMISISSIASPELQIVTIMMIQMSLQCLMVLDGSSRLFTQAWTIWTCRPIPLLSGQRWQSQATLRRPMMTTIAHNHLTRQNSPQYRRPQRTWAPSTAGRRHTLPLTTTNFTQATNPEGYISFLQVPRRRHHLHEGRKESWAWECPLQKRGECRRRSPQQRTSQVNREGSRTVEISNLLTNYDFIHLNIHFNIYSLIYT